jgi:hypothetical protein
MLRTHNRFNPETAFGCFHGDEISLGPSANVLAFRGAVTPTTAISIEEPIFTRARDNALAL